VRAKLGVAIPEVENAMLVATKEAA
jgi:hypothetical protein